MRLINPGVGDVSDRLTVLSLKILHRGAEGKPTKHFEDERNVLLVQIRAREVNGQWFEQVLALGAVNAAVWYAEDALRELRKGGGTPEEITAVYGIAFRIQELNDQRSALVEAINKLTGTHLGSEKT
jgi:hypothetical protein